MPASQAGRRRFESGLPLHLFNHLHTSPNQHLSHLSQLGIAATGREGLKICPKCRHRLAFCGHGRIDVFRQVDTQAVALLIGDDLGVRTPFLVQGGVRSPQDGEVDPVEFPGVPGAGTRHHVDHCVRYAIAPARTSLASISDNVPASTPILMKPGRIPVWRIPCSASRIQSCAIARAGCSTALRGTYRSFAAPYRPVLVRMCSPVLTEMVRRSSGSRPNHAAVPSATAPQPSFLMDSA